MGGGVAGLSAALVLARHGLRVTVVERDGFELGPAPAAPGWQRKGIPHFLQPHAFIPRGRLELREQLADVYATLLDVGALGRRTPVAGWLSEAGIVTPPAQTSNCGVTYYSRYYRQRPGFELPDGPWFLSPRGDLGYFGYASFPGDNRTFAAVLAVPPGIREWKVFRDAAAFEAAIARIPGLRQWVDPDGVDPITAVLPMAGLRNSLASYDGMPVVGMFRVGDAICHTDPTLAHGLAFALIHARQLGIALTEHKDPGDAAEAYLAATLPALRERYEFATALDAQRRRLWLGEPVDFAHRDGDYALFSMSAAAAAATIDPDIFRAFNRRIGLLDSTAVLDDNTDLQRRIENGEAEGQAGVAAEGHHRLARRAGIARHARAGRWSVRQHRDHRPVPRPRQADLRRWAGGDGRRHQQLGLAHRRAADRSSAGRGQRRSGLSRPVPGPGPPQGVPAFHDRSQHGRRAGDRGDVSLAPLPHSHRHRRSRRMRAGPARAAPSAAGWRRVRPARRSTGLR